jgi:hypothetical protein
MIHFDVVTVPDFSGEAGARFELCTLFFLAAWQANGGAAKRYPLHLACIGEPPVRVQRLAAQVGAQISCHQPMGRGMSRTANKLRGLEVAAQGSQRLLLDSDVLILNDFSALALLGNCLAAAPALSPRLPQADWPAVYTAVGQSMPQQRIQCVLQELGIAPHEYDFVGQKAEFSLMPPYYNSGVLWIPTAIDLRHVWEDYLLRTSNLFPDEPRWRAARHGDQVALAPAIQYLQSKEVPFRRLPATFHAAWPHVYRGYAGFVGKVSWQNFAIFHAIGLGKMDFKHQPLRHSITAYQTYLWQQLQRAANRLPRARRLWVKGTRRWGWYDNLAYLRNHLAYLYQTYIEPLNQLATDTATAEWRAEVQAEWLGGDR